VKRILVVLISFALISGVCVYCRTLTRTVNTHIEDCLQDIENAAKSENKPKCIELADKLIEQADGAGEKLGSFYPHMYGEALKENCRRIEFCIDKEQWMLLDEAIEECRYVLKTIILQEQIRWENVF